MGHSNIIATDLVVLGAMLFSGYLAYKRGLVREVLALGTWVLASLVAISFYPIVKPWVNEHITNETAADAATALGLFSITLIGLVPLGNYLTGLVKGPNLSAIDKSLGFVFGVVRGFFIVALIYFAATLIWPENSERSQPSWMAEAKTKPMLAFGVELMTSLVPGNPSEFATLQIKKGRDAAEEAAEQAQKLEEISTPVPSYGKAKEKVQTYGDDTRTKMNNLIDQKASP